MVETGARNRTGRHPAWIVAAVAFVALIGAAGFRAAPGVLIVPLEAEFGWSRGRALDRRRGQPGAVRPHGAVRRRADGPVRHPRR